MRIGPEEKKDVMMRKKYSSDFHFESHPGYDDTRLAASVKTAQKTEKLCRITLKKISTNAGRPRLVRREYCRKSRISTTIRMSLLSYLLVFVKLQC